VGNGETGTLDLYSPPDHLVKAAEFVVYANILFLYHMIYMIS